MKIGAVSYYNAWPLTAGLGEIVLAPPKQLTELMKRGEIDVALLPVVGIAQNDFIAYPQAGIIASDQYVASVGFFLKPGLSELKQARSIYWDQESLTSVQLGKFLLEKIVGKSWHDWKVVTDFDQSKNADVRLLIGDKALFFNEPGWTYFDSVELWRSLTGHGFVFASWCSSKELSEEEIAALAQARKLGMSDLAKLAQNLPASQKDIILKYWRENIRYELTPDLQAGWQEFLDRHLSAQSAASLRKPRPQRHWKD